MVATGVWALGDKAQAMGKNYDHAYGRYETQRDKHNVKKQRRYIANFFAHAGITHLPAYKNGDKQPA